MDLRNIKAKDIMRKNVIVASPDEIVGAAKLRMVRKNIGGLPVVKKNKLVGIVTMRDIELIGNETLGLKVKDIMTKDVVTVSPDTTLKDIVKIMREKGYQRLPVIEKGKLVGIVTQSCVIDAVLRYLIEMGI
jgi:CBS domain-containing protein